MSYAIGGEANFYEPRDEPSPECQWCDGQKWVDVASIVDVSGNVHPLPQDMFLFRQHEVKCPRCVEEPGVEPKPEKEA